MIRSFAYTVISLLICSVLTSCAPGTNQHPRKTMSVKDTTTTQSEAAVPPPDSSFPERWAAGTIVDSTQVYDHGIEKCFTADTISDSLFQMMKDVTFHDDTPVGRSDLRYLRVLHYNSEGSILLGEMICNRVIASDLLEIFRDLFFARYPIERMRLTCRYEGDDEASMTDNNTSCFNSRTITGSSRHSLHASGMAVDINPLYNPYIKAKDGKVVKILPKAAINSDRDSPYRIEKGDLCYRLFTAHGFKWGGSWRTVKDYQHFEKHN